MSEVGHAGLSYTEWATHYASWAIVSSPQILGFDLTNATLVNEVWPIISNAETMEVSQTYYGFSGSQYAASSATANLCTAEQRADGETVCLDAPLWMALYKPIDAARTAVLVINNDVNADDLTVDFSAVPNLPCGTSCKVRDISAQADKGSFTGAYTVKGVASHDAVFVMLSK